MGARGQSYPLMNATTLAKAEITSADGEPHGCIWIVSLSLHQNVKCNVPLGFKY